MSATDYNKGDLLELGDCLDELIDGITGDGIGSDDLGKLISTFTAGAKTVNEMKAVPVGAGMHLAGRVLDKQGDRMVAKAIADEEAAAL